MTVKLMCTLLIPVGVIPEVGAMCLKEKTPETCSWRYIIYGGSYAISKGEGLLQAWSLSLMMMTVIDPGQGLLPVNLSLIMKIAIIGEGAEAQRIGDWGMML